MKIKAWWIERPYWQKGGFFGIITFFVLVILYYLLFLIAGDMNPFADFLVKTSFLTGHGFIFFAHFIFEGNNPISSMFKSFSIEEFMVFTAISLLVIYSLLGSIIGLIVGKIKSKK